MKRVEGRTGIAGKNLRVAQLRQLRIGPFPVCGRVGNRQGIGSFLHPSLAIYRWVGVGGAGGSVGDCWGPGGSTHLHGLFAISVLSVRNWLQPASVASQSWVSCPLSKHHSWPFEPGPD